MKSSLTLGATIAALVAILTSAGTGHAVPGDNTTRLSGTSPFADCTADDDPGEDYVLNSEAEPTVAVHPRAPFKIAVAWRQDQWATGSSRGIVVAATRNGGFTWKKTVLQGVSACSGGEGRVTNPWLHYAADGTLYASVTIFGGWESTIGVSRSTDGGFTWTAPAALTSDPMPRFYNDKQAVTSDPADPQRVYAVWNRRDRDQDVHDVMFAHSDDGGRTWSPAESIHRPVTRGAGTLGNQVVVLPDGDLVSVFGENEHAIGGDPWPPDIPERIRVIRSADRGESWSDPITVADFTAGQPLLPDNPTIPVVAPGTVPDIAVDPRSGRLYVVWGDATLSESANAVALSTSSDGGRTWSPARRVNRTPDSSPYGTGQAFLPQVEVTRSGTVGVSYHDFRDDTPDAGTKTGVWLATCRARCGSGAGWREQRIAGPFDLEKAPWWFGGPYIGSSIGLAGGIHRFAHAPIMTRSDEHDPTDAFLVLARPRP